MEKRNCSAEIQQLLLKLLNKVEKQEAPVISLVEIGRTIEDFDKKPNFREPSLRTKYEAAMKQLECDGDLYRISKIFPKFYRRAV